jgi:hypothetical protein
MGQLLFVTEPVGAGRKVPTSPAIVPFVQVTLALASTTNVDAAADGLPLMPERSVDELTGDAESPLAAESSATVTRAPAANLA